MNKQNKTHTSNATDQAWEAYEDGQYVEMLQAIAGGADIYSTRPDPDDSYGRGELSILSGLLARQADGEDLRAVLLDLVSIVRPQDTDAGEILESYLIATDRYAKTIHPGRLAVICKYINPNTPGNFGDLPLATALNLGQVTGRETDFSRGRGLALARELLRQGANPNAQEISGDPLIFTCIYHTQGDDVLRMLLRHGADIMQTNNEQQNIIHVAGLYLNTHIFETIHKANPEAFSIMLKQKDHNGRTAVELAEYAGHPETVATLRYYTAKLEREALTKAIGRRATACDTTATPRKM